MGSDAQLAPYPMAKANTIAAAAPGVYERFTMT